MEPLGDVVMDFAPRLDHAAPDSSPTKPVTEFPAPCPVTRAATHCHFPGAKTPLLVRA